MAQTNINVRMDAELKEQFSKLCDDLGFNVSTAVNIFAKAMVHYQGIPFEVNRKTPNDETIAAMLEAERIAKDPSVKGYTDVNELFADLDR